uniref:Uncharacterized protein n=1 Tax=Acrobeloides nanus TaxID=290746 RepID=A0A914C735_9BILA
MQFIPYDLISFHIENIQASFNLQFYGVFGPFEVPGNIYAQLNDLSIYIKLKTIPSKLYPNAIALLNCATSLNNARYTFEPSSSYAWAGWMKTFEQSQMRMLESEADYAIRNNIGLIILDTLSTRVDTLSTRVDTLSTRVDTLSTRVDTLSTPVDKVSTLVDKVSTEVDKPKNYQKWQKTLF